MLGQDIGHGLQFCFLRNQLSIAYDTASMISFGRRLMASR
jgi:hypothetical protein